MRVHSWHGTFAVLFAVLGLFAATGVQAGALERLFAPKAKLWDVWTAHDPDSRASLDHTAWDQFITTYRRLGDDGVSLVAYAEVTAADQSALAAYIDALEDVSISRYSRTEQLAYWVNLYNALTVDVVLAHYPVESIRDIKLSGGFLSKGPWSKPLATVEGKEVSLNDIEHRILRPIWRDPRIHYAVNCASLGCPNLADEAFTATNVESLLDGGARAYVNHPRGVRVENDRLQVSSIYEWFQKDFGGSDDRVIEHLRKYAEPPLAAALANFDKISDADYDWRLNDGSNR